MCGPRDLGDFGSCNSKWPSRWKVWWVGGGRDKVKRFGGRQGQVARGWPSMGVRLGFSLGFEGLGFLAARVWGLAI